MWLLLVVRTSNCSSTSSSVFKASSSARYKPPKSPFPFRGICVNACVLSFCSGDRRSAANTVPKMADSLMVQEDLEKEVQASNRSRTEELQTARHPPLVANGV